VMLSSNKSYDPVESYGSLTGQKFIVRRRLIYDKSEDKSDSIRHKLKKELKILAYMGTNTFWTEFVDLYREQVCLWDGKS